ncbi:MAG: glycoside hydrolase family 3 N-terminal domain-containing protein [Caldilineaceae bacterium]
MPRLPAPPATLDSKLLIDLLRQELGFDGMIVSDNAGMIGLTIHTTPEDQIVQSIASGIDMYLNADPDHDFDRLLQGVRDGRLSEERIQDATRRVLEMKSASQPLCALCRACAHRGTERKFRHRGPDNGGQKRHDSASERAVGPHAGSGGQGVDRHLRPIFADVWGERSEEFDQALGERGYAVTHLLNPGSDELRQAAEGCQAVFINLSAMPFVTLANIRMTDTFRTWGWRSLYRSHPQVVYTAFGNPYIAYEAPNCPG